MSKLVPKNSIKKLPGIIKDIFSREKMPNDPKINNCLSIAELENATEEAALKYENMYLGTDLFIQVMFINKNGAFIFVPLEKPLDESNKKVIHKKITLAVNRIRDYFMLSGRNSFIFFYSDDESYIYDSKEILVLNDIYESFQNLFENTLRPEVDMNFIRFHSLSSMLEVPDIPEEYKTGNELNGMMYTHNGEVFVIEDENDIVYTGDTNYVKFVLSEDDIERIDKMAAPIENNERPELTIKYDEEGNQYILRYSEVRIGGNKGLNTGLIGKKKWFRLSDKNPDTMALMITFGGWFGLHKFYEGKITEGIFYLVTCGCMGILPAIDLIQLILGAGYYYEITYYEDCDENLHREKSKVYLRKPKSKVFSIIGIFISAGISLLIAKTLYCMLFMLLMQLVVSKGQNMSEESMTNIIDTLQKLSKWR